MKEKKDLSNLKIILDTNLFISFLINDDIQFLTELFRLEKIDLIVSKELIDEISRVACRPKFSKFINKEQVDTIVHLISNFGIKVDVTSDVTICRDKNDNYLLALAKDSNADFLLTGDKDLLLLHKFDNTFIVKINEFKQLMKNFSTL